MKLTENSKAQTISTDAVIAVVLFTLAIIFFFALSTDTTTRKIEDLERESTKLSGEISCKDANGESLLDGQTVNEDVLKELAKMSCDELKKCLGLNTNLCIYFQDEHDGVVEIDTAEGGIYGIGCKEFKLTTRKVCGNKPNPNP